MRSLFEKNENSKRDARIFVTFGDESVRDLGPHIWKVLPAQLKRETSYGKLTTQINNWLDLNGTAGLASIWKIKLQLYFIMILIN